MFFFSIDNMQMSEIYYIFEINYEGFLDNETPRNHRNGEIAYCSNVDPDRMSYFELMDLLEDMYIDKRRTIYYKLPGRFE